MVGAQEWRLGNKIQPVKQSVYLTVDPAARGPFSGSTEIQVKVAEASKAVRFHALDIKVTKAELIQGKKHLPLQVASGQYAMVSASAGHPIAPGKYALHLEFPAPSTTTRRGSTQFHRARAWPT